jgi:hypothetical protein
MTPDAFLAEAERRLAEAKFAVERLALPGAPAVVGRRKPFRVQWVLTQLKTSVVVATVESVDVGGWQRFAQDSFAAAKAIKGGLPTGIQSGIGAVPVLAATHVDPAAAAVARERPRAEWFTGIAMPALVDLTTGEVHEFAGRILVGAIYAPYLRKQRALVTSIVRQEK